MSNSLCPWTPRYGRVSYIEGPRLQIFQSHRPRAQHCALSERYSWRDKGICGNPRIGTQRNRTRKQLEMSIINTMVTGTEVSALRHQRSTTHSYRSHVVTVDIRADKTQIPENKIRRVPNPSGPPNVTTFTYLCSEHPQQQNSPRPKQCWCPSGTTTPDALPHKPFEPMT